MRTIGRYEIEAEIGRGGMGAVFKGHDPALARPVAIKLLLGFRNPKSRRRFQTEVQTLAKIRHPSVVGVHASGEHDGVPYLVMDWVEGSSLEELLQREGPLDERRAAEITRSLGLALAEIHAEGVLHRDLKPSNVLMNLQGHPLLTDFGLAKDLQQELTGSVASMQGAFLGTPGFLPPEQAKGELHRVGPRSDIYGLGATLYAMLTGEAPYSGDNPFEVLAAMDQPPKTPSGIRGPLDPRLEAICMRCLAGKPALRYPDAAALVADLDRFLAGPDGSPWPTKALAASLVLAAVGIAGWLLLPASEPTQTERPDSAAPSAPSAPSDEAQQAERLLASGEWQAAEALLTTALQARGQDATLYLLRSRARRQGQDGEGAEADASSAIALAEDRAEAWFARALTRADRRDWRGALADADHAIALAPTTEHFLMRGELRVAQGDVDGGITDATTALHHDPQSADAHNHRGSLWHQLGDLAQAEADYRAAIELDRAHHEARRNLGVLWIEQQRLELALPLLVETTTQDHADAVDWLHLGTVCADLGRIDQALDALHTSTELDPSLPNAWFVRGRLLVSAGRYEEALAALDRAAEAAPDFAQVFLQRGMAHSALGHHPQAAQDYEQALALDPALDNARFNLAGTLASLGQLEQAEGLYTACLQRQPQDVQALELRHQLRRQLGRADGALQDLEALIRLRPEHAAYMEQRYRYLRQLERDDAALPALEAWLQVATPTSKLLLERALLQTEQGDAPGIIDTAQRLFADHPEVLERMAGEGDPQAAQGWLEFGVVAKYRGRPADALLGLSWSILLDDQRWEGWTERAAIRQQLGDTEGGLADLERALALAPEQPLVHYQRYRLLSAQGQRVLARESLSRTLQLDREFAPGWFAQAEWLDDEDPQAAMEAYRRTLELEPDHEGALNNLSILLVERGFLEEADAVASRLIALNPDDLGARLTRAAARRRLGDVQGSLEDYAHAEQTDPEAWQPWAGAGQLLRAEGRYGEAEPALSKAIELLPEGADAAALYQQRAVTRRKLEEWRLAAEDFAAYLEARPDRHDMRLQRADCLEAAGEWREALLECRRVAREATGGEQAQAEERITTLERKLGGD